MEMNRFCLNCGKDLDVKTQDVGVLHLHWEGVGVESRDKYFCSYNCLELVSYGEITAKV